MIMGVIYADGNEQIAILFFYVKHYLSQITHELIDAFSTGVDIGVPGHTWWKKPEDSKKSTGLEHR